MPFVKAWMHLVWSTKNRQPFLADNIRQKVFQHIRENARKKDIFLDFVNGYRDHIHCLVSLGVDQTIAKTVQLIKGESSFWINKERLIEEHFEWQDEYFAVSVSESQVNVVRSYIKNQEEHHRHKTFQQEYEEFIKNYGFEKFG
jgi:REP element-mobilizing transposase RayT